MPYIQSCDLHLLAYWNRHADEIALNRGWNGNNTFSCPTKDSYDSKMCQLAPLLPKKSISELTYFDIQDALDKIRSKNPRGGMYSDSSMKNFRSILHDIYSFAEDRGDAYDIFRDFSYKNPSKAPPILDPNLFDFSLPKAIMQVRVRAALESKRFRPRSLTPAQQAHLIRVIQENLANDGRYCGLAIMLYTGTRPAECRKITWGDLVPFLDHPDRLILYLYDTLDRRGKLANKMKTRNAYRRIPVHIELQKLLLERKRIVENHLKAINSTADINKLPVCCMLNEFDRPCRDYELATLATDALDKLSISKEELSVYVLFFMFASLIKTSNNKNDDDSHLSLYVLRRNFWTWLQSSTQLTETEKLYIMGHEMELNGEDLRPRYNNEDRLWAIGQKIDRHIISLKLHKDLLYEHLPSNRPIALENRGVVFLKLSPEQLTTGGTLTIRATSIEVDDEIMLKILSNVQPYGRLTINSHITDHLPITNATISGLNCECEEFQVLNRLREKK